MPTATIMLQLDALAALKATGNPLNNASLFLFTNLVTIDQNTTLGMLTEATFNGYTRAAALAFGTPYIPLQGPPVIVSPSQTFIAIDASITETIYGWGIANNGFTQLWYAELLARPVPINAPSDGLTVDIEIPYGA